MYLNYLICTYPHIRDLPMLDFLTQRVVCAGLQRDSVCLGACWISQLVISLYGLEKEFDGLF